MRLPDPGDERSILQFCSDAAKDIERMNAQICRLQSSLDSITQKRDSLQRHVSALRRSIAPPIPTEILQHIFRSCVELFPVISSSGCKEAPALLTRVCSRWRSIALDTPDLWSAMHVVVPGHNTFRFPSRCRAIRNVVATFIERSRDLPLYVSVYSWAFYKHMFETDVIAEDEDDFTALLDLLQQLVGHSKRWKYVKLLVPFWCFSQATSHLTSDDVPELETAILAGRGINFLSDAPRLQQLALQYHSNFLSPLPLEGEMWGRLQTLKLNVCFGTGTLGLFSVLQACTNLRECMLDLGFLHMPMIGLPPNQGNLVLSHLRELHLIDARKNEILSEVLRWLSTPALEHLCLFNTQISHFRMNKDTLLCLDAFLDRSKCSLIKLLFLMTQTPELTSNDVLEFLRGIHDTLQTLIIESRADEDTYFMNDDILRALSVVSPPQDVLCPNLRRMIFSDGGSISEQTLREFISARVVGRDADATSETESQSSVEPLDHLLVYTRQTGFAASINADYPDLVSDRIEVVEEVDLGQTQDTTDAPTYFKAYKESYGPSSRDVEVID
ncbi:hypothetical protein VKT23_003872 [Stygiomarasmius scandens]|uniref:F-box domain-containing protein n=1 Tax=Marasmiellus scandens TaxID=2682957 RepID=A0ABR1K2U7_9AGAR